MAPTAAAPGMGSRSPASLGARRRALFVVALLLSVALLGGLAWTLTRSFSEQGTPGAGGAELVEVPDVVGLSRVEATKRLDSVGLEPGSQHEAPSDEFAEGLVSTQDPGAGTEVERGTTVDLVVSTGPAQEPTPTASPTASPAASPTATATATASPASNEEAKKRREERRKEAEEAAEERRKEQEKAAKEREKEAEEAREEAKKDR